MIRRYACHCEAMLTVDDSKEDNSGWLFYEAITENGKRTYGLCPRCQAAFKCYLDNNPISKDVKVEKPETKRGRPPKKKKEE